MGRAGLEHSQAAPGAKYCVTASTGRRRPVSLTSQSTRREVEPVRHRRHFSENDSAALLVAIGECRRACIAANTKAPIGGASRRCLQRARDRGVCLSSTFEEGSQKTRTRFTEQP